MGRRLSGRLVPVLATALLLSSSSFCVPPAHSTPVKDPSGWWDPNWHYRIAFTIGPADFELVNYPVEMELSFTRLVEDAGGTDGPPNPDSLRLIQYDGEGALAEPVGQADGTLFIPLTFTKGPGHDARKSASGTVTFAVNGTVPEGGLRHYQLYFDAGKDFTAPAYDTAHLESLYWMSRGQVFYGFNPGVESAYGDIEALHVIGLHDDTAVSVHDITGGGRSLIGTGTTAAGGLLAFKVPDGAYFSVEADKPVVASMDDCVNMTAACYYPSRDGGLAGNDFWFMAYRQDPGCTYIQAVENGTATIFNEGVVVERAVLRTDDRITFLNLTGGKIYHAVSTGRMMMGTMAMNGFTAVPSMNGCPNGKEFLAGIRYWKWERPTYNFCTVGHVGNTNMTVTAPDAEIANGTENGYGSTLGWQLGESPDRYFIRINTSGESTVIAGGCEMQKAPDGIGDDITFAGGYHAREFVADSYSNPPPPPQDPRYPGGSPSAIVFPFFDCTTLTFDDGPLVLGNGQYLAFAGGHFLSDKPVSVMILGRGLDGSEKHRWNDWGTYLAGRLLSPPTTTGKAEHFGERFGVELLPGTGENEAAPGIMLHRADPGAPSVFRLALRNAGNAVDAYTLEVGGAQAGWTVATDAPGGTGLLEPGGLLDFTVTLAPPPDAQADDWAELAVGARSPASGAGDNLTLRCVVDATCFVRLLCAGTVKYVDPGSPAVFGFTLQNEANAPDNMTLSAAYECGEAWPFALSLEAAALGTGQKTELNLTVRCPDGTRALLETAVRVTARSLSNRTMTSTVATLTVCNLVRGIGISAEPHRRSVRPGREAAFDITLNSTGNAVEDIALHVTGAPGSWEAGLPAGRLSLDMNGTRTLRLLVVPPGNAPPGRTWLRVVASGSAGASGNVSVAVDVLDTPAGDRLTLDESCPAVAALVLVTAVGAAAASGWRRRTDRSA